MCFTTLCGGLRETEYEKKLALETGVVGIGSRHAERVDVFGAAPHNFVGE